MTSLYQSMVLNAVKDALNSVRETLELPLVRVDELNTQGDSASVGIEEGSGSIERLSDCTGTAMHGVLRISLVYRVMQSVVGSDDLKYATILDNAYQYLRQNYKSIDLTNAFIDSVSQPSGAVLSAIYQGGVKDFKTIIVVEYERRV